MKRCSSLVGMIGATLATVLAAGCGEDSPAPRPSPYMPAIPVPTSPTDDLPVRSAEVVVGLSSPLETFEPIVSEIELMWDSGAVAWVTMNRRALLVCGPVLPEYACDPARGDRAFVSAAPRLAHRRYWRKLKQVTLEPGASYSKEESITYGTSTSSTESREFSRTIGVEVTAEGGWGAFGVSVTGYYEQTETATLVQSVSFDTEHTISETYAVEPDAGHTRVYALWQLVDKFSYVDADLVRIHESSTLRHVRMPAIVEIEFPNSDVIYQSVTAFD